MSRKLLTALLACLLCTLGNAQIVNRLRVDKDTFLRYAYCRMQQFNPANLELADSLRVVGIRKDDYRYKCLSLSLEMPVRFAQRDFVRMDATAAELKALLADRKKDRSFYYSFLHEYCEYLVQAGMATKAMLEARDMGRLASSEQQPLGKMYSYRILGLIHSARDNHVLAIRNFEEAVTFSRAAREEQDLPKLYLLLAQELAFMGEFDRAETYLEKAEEYKRFFPSIGVKAQMTRAGIYYAQGDIEAFRETYADLLKNPLYRMQADADSRYGLDISYLRSYSLLDEALAKADSIGTRIERLGHKHAIYSDMNAFGAAYDSLAMLMGDKDSLYIKVQNEDLAILDAEMHNAQLREVVQRLEARNQSTILFGFLFLFAIAFIALMVSQWNLRRNLDQMRMMNNAMLEARRAYQNTMDAKESENSFRIKILQNRKTNMLRL